MFYSTDRQQYELVGIIGPRAACLTRGLFTRVGPFVPWIMETMKNPPPPTTLFPLFTLPTELLSTPGPDLLGDRRLPPPH